MVGIGVTIVPLGLAVEIFSIYQSLTADTMAALTTPGSSAYIPHFATFLVIQLLIYLVLFIAGVVKALFFYTKNYRFPRLYIALAIAYPLVVLVNAWLSSLVLPNVQGIFDKSTLHNLLSTLLPAAIWIPYMLMSERVALTFVRGRKAVSSPLVAAED